MSDDECVCVSVVKLLLVTAYQNSFRPLSQELKRTKQIGGRG